MNISNSIIFVLHACLPSKVHKHVLFSASEEDDTLYKKETIHVIIEAMKVRLCLDDTELATIPLFHYVPDVPRPAKTRTYPAVLHKRSQK